MSDLFELATKHGFIEQDKEDQIIIGLRKYLVEKPDNEVAKRWLKQRIDKQARDATIKSTINNNTMDTTPTAPKEPTPEEEVKN